MHEKLTKQTTTVEEVRHAYSRILLRFDEKTVLPTAYREAVSLPPRSRRALRHGWRRTGSEVSGVSISVDFASGAGTALLDGDTEQVTDLVGK